MKSFEQKRAPDFLEIKKESEPEPKITRIVEARSFEDIETSFLDQKEETEILERELPKEILEKNASQLFRILQDARSDQKEIKGLEYDDFDAKEALREVIAKRNREDDSRATKKKIEEIKKKLAIQQLGIAETIRNLEMAVLMNPEISGESLKDFVKKMAPSFNFSHRQLENFLKGIEEYSRRHAIIKEFKNEHSDNEELCEALFGIKPKGKVEVQQGPLTLHIKFFDEDDFEAVCLQGEDSNKLEEKRRKIKATVGVLVSRLRIPKLQGLVSIERAGISKSVDIHEEQHAFVRLFDSDKDIFLDDLMDKMIANKKEDSRVLNDPVIERIITDTILMFRRSGVERMIKEEIAAYYREGVLCDKLMDSLKNYDFKGEVESKRGSVVDWVRILIEDHYSELIYKDRLEDKEKYFEKNEKGYLVDFKKLSISEEKIKNFVDKIFGEDLIKDLKEWINAIKQLENMNYSREDILALIYQEPIYKWPSIVRRLAKLSAAERF